MIDLRPKTFRIFYGWYVLTAAFLVWTIGHGVQFSFGVFLKPLSENFEWSRSLIAGAFMLCMLCRGGSSIVMGGLTDKYGPRAIVGIGGFLMGVGMLLSSTMTRVWELYLFYGVLAGVGMGVVVVPLSATVSRWFVARRGLAQGILVAGAGLSNLVISPLAGYLIRSFGIKGAYLLIGSSTLVLINLLARVLRKEPSDMGLMPYGSEMRSLLPHQEFKEEKSGTAEGPWSISQALRTLSLWFLATINFFFGIGLSLVMANIVAYATDLEISRATAPYLLSLIGAGNILGIIVMGFLTERIGARPALVLCLGIQALALFWLAGVSGLPQLCLVAAIFGVSYAGVALGVLLIIPEFFGLKSLGSIMGFIYLVQILGAAVGSELGNLIYDFTEPHSYSSAFFLEGALFVAAFTLAVIMKKPTWKGKGGGHA